MGVAVSRGRARQRAAEETVLIEVPESDAVELPPPKTFETKEVSATVESSDAEIQNSVKMVDVAVQQEFPEIILKYFL